MSEAVNLSAILVARQVDIKGVKSLLVVRPVAESSTELLYDLGGNRYQYYFNYGVVVFSGHSEEEIKAAIKSVGPHLRSPLSPWMRDDHEVRTTPDSEPEFEFDYVVVDHLDLKVFRIIMFNLAQSVALDNYNGVSENLLTEIRGFSNGLENTGKLNIGRRSMMKFIGRALNTQNDIADNIYIFDAPEQVWDEEYLDQLHKGLMKHFDLRMRFSEIEYMWKITENNLRMFQEISHHRESNKLEWIIIALILVEVLNLVIKEIF